jgi:hypothetical protein
VAIQEPFGGVAGVLGEQLQVPEETPAKESVGNVATQRQRCLAKSSLMAAARKLLEESKGHFFGYVYETVFSEGQQHGRRFIH